MVRFLSVYPEKGAEHLLKSASDRFEKSKRMHIYENSLRSNEEGIQEVNRGFNFFFFFCFILP